MKSRLFALLVAAASPAAAAAQSAEAVKFDYVESLLQAGDDTTYVINFWATWCKPCIQEMPELLRFEQETAQQKVKLVLVSLDFADRIESQVNPFLRARAIASRTVVLDDLDYNAWIDRVHPGWNGGIPATLVVNRKRGLRAFHEGMLDAAQLRRMAFARAEGN
jgi:thiol-disulfide isomerase/thioredoxin